MTDVDFGRRSDDYARHRPGFPDSFYDRLEQLRPFAGLEALDIGTGPGVIALELARRGARVTGLDLAAEQVRAARQRAENAGLADRCQFVVGRTEHTGLAAARFDLVTAGQCWHWFDEAAALAELQRVLALGGLLVVAQYCYLPRHSEVARATEALVLRYNPGWTMADHDGLFVRQVDGLSLAGFELVEQFCYDHVRDFSHVDWRGRMRTCNGVGSGPLTPAQVTAFDAELAALLAERFADEPLRIPHRVWATVVRWPG